MKRRKKARASNSMEEDAAKKRSAKNCSVPQNFDASSGSSKEKRQKKEGNVNDMKKSPPKKCVRPSDLWVLNPKK